MRASITSLVVALAVVCAVAQTRTARTLDIYVVDVEGGNATLFVAPSGGSVLIDTGNGGAAGSRDAGRIMAAVKDAGLSQIDHLITTHWHGDHFGGMCEPSWRIPIRQFIDHGPTVEPQPASTAFLQDVYPSLYAKGTHTIAKPGDRIPVAGLDWRVVASAGQMIKTPLPGAGRSNPYCAGFAPQAADAIKILYTAPGMEDLWQMHFSLLSGQEYTVPGVFIANPIDDQPAALPVASMPPPAGAGAPPPPAHNGPAYWIKVSAQADGSFTVTNARNRFSKTYSALP